MIQILSSVLSKLADPAKALPMFSRCCTPVSNLRTHALSRVSRREALKNIGLS